MTLTTEQALAKVAADVQEVMGGVQADPAAAAAFVGPIMELFVEFGYFEQAAGGGEQNTIKWMMGTLVSMKEDLKESQKFIKTFKELLTTKQVTDAALDELVQTGSVIEE